MSFCRFTGKLDATLGPINPLELVFDHNVGIPDSDARDLELAASEPGSGMIYKLTASYNMTDDFSDRSILKAESDTRFLLSCGRTRRPKFLGHVVGAETKTDRANPSYVICLNCEVIFSMMASGRTAQASYTEIGYNMVSWISCKKSFVVFTH